MWLQARAPMVARAEVEGGDQAFACDGAEEQRVLPVDERGDGVIAPAVPSSADVVTLVVGEVALSFEGGIELAQLRELRGRQDRPQHRVPMLPNMLQRGRRLLAPRALSLCHEPQRNEHSSVGEEGPVLRLERARP